MKKLRETGLEDLITKLNQPVLGICLGMQLMCSKLEEGNTNGLGIFDVAVKRFSTSVKVPQMGWNTITNLKSKLFEDISDKEYMYLVHSYYVEENENTISTTDYELPYASSIKKNNFYGVQFHPEKSGKSGERVLQNFLNL